LFPVEIGVAGHILAFRNFFKNVMDNAQVELSFWLWRGVLLF
jgi:hypothetical protein